MALSFPASPTVGQQYTDSNRTWEWNGQTWEAISSADFGTGTLTIPVSSSLPTGEGQIVFDGTTDTLHIGEGVGSIQIAKDADIPQSIIELGIADGTAGQFLSTDGAGNFIFANVAGGSGATTLDELTDVTTSGATNGQVLTADGAGNFTFSSIAGGGAETVTSLAYNNATSMLTYTDEAGADTVLDLTNLLDDTNIITDVNGQTGSVSLTLDNLADVTAAGSTAGQILSSDGAGAYSFIDHYGDPDVAAYLNGNVDTTILPDTADTYNIGAVGSKFSAIYATTVKADNAEVSTVVANTHKSYGQFRLEAGSDFIFDGDRINGTGANTLDIGEAIFPMKEIHTNNLASYTTLTIPINNTPNTADGSMTWDGTNNKLYVGDGTTAIEIGAGGAYTDPDAVAAVVASDLDMGGNRVLFANVYTNFADLPSATGNHGMFAHVHNDNAAYYAHAGNWTKLANDGDVPAAITDLGITDGTAGQVLSTDGAGNFTFTTVSGGGGSVALDDVTDVTATGSTAGQVLASDGAGNYGFTDPTLPSIIDILNVTDGVVGNVLQKTGAGTYGFSQFTLGEIGNVDDTATTGQVLTADGTGNFTFTTVSGGGGGASRNQYAGTTASLADQASGDLDVTGCKTYTLFKIQTDVAAWVTLYTDAASRTADTRTYSDKGSDSATEGVVAEVITTGAQTVIVAPGVIGFNNEGTPTTNIPMRVFNDSGGAATVTVTVDVLTLEA